MIWERWVRLVGLRSWGCRLTAYPFAKTIGKGTYSATTHKRFEARPLNDGPHTNANLSDRPADDTCVHSRLGRWRRPISPAPAPRRPLPRALIGAANGFLPPFCSPLSRFLCLCDSLLSFGHLSFSRRESRLPRLSLYAVSRKSRDNITATAESRRSPNIARATSSIHTAFGCAMNCFEVN